jgi:hypothetical protein
VREADSHHAVGRKGDAALITVDFSDLRTYTPGTHAGLLLVRLARPGRNALVARVSMRFATESVEQWRGCLVVASDHKVRVKRPG